MPSPCPPASETLSSPSSPSHCYAIPLEPARLRTYLTRWNLIGLIDIILVVISAVRINSADPGQLRALTHLPLSLLPTFLVPLIIATHIMIFARLLRR